MTTSESRPGFFTERIDSRNESIRIANWNALTSSLQQILCALHITCGRGSVLLWSRFRALLTSGFVDDVIFACLHIMAMGR